MNRDNDVVARALAGQTTAQREIVERLTRRVRGLALSILGRADEVDDVTQHIFLELFRSLATFQGPSLLSWADSVAVRTAVKHARRGRKRMALSTPVEPDDLSSATVLPADHALPRPLLSYLAELPEARRVVLVMRHVLNYTVEEIAEITHVPANTVKDRLHQARQQLRKTVRRELKLLRVVPTRRDT